MRQLYVTTARGLRRVADAIGLLGLAERSKSPTVLWLRSLLSIYDSADLARLDVPWWTYAAIGEVASHITAKAGRVRVLEYGSGASTIWLARRALEVNTIEHDVAFSKLMGPLFAEFANIKMTVCPPETVSPSTHSRSKRRGYEDQSFDRYVNAADGYDGKFDIVVIDGRSRIYCLEKAVERLAPQGIIVFDNSNRREYREAITTSGLKETRFCGLAPALPYPSQTSILQKGEAA